MDSVKNILIEEVKSLSSDSLKICDDLDEDCLDYEEGFYSDGTKRSYVKCFMYDPKGYCPFIHTCN